MKRKVHRYHLRYPNLTYALLGIILALLLARIPQFHEAVANLHTYGYIGAFIAGIFFVSTLTVATGALVLIFLAQSHSILIISLIAGGGALVGDAILFRFFQNSLAQEIQAVCSRIDKKKHIQKVLSLPMLRWLLPLLGIIIIASPLPDEIGISLIGISHISPARLAVLSYVLNTIGIYLMLQAAQAIAI